MNSNIYIVFPLSLGTHSALHQITVHQTEEQVEMMVIKLSTFWLVDNLAVLSCNLKVEL